MFVFLETLLRFMYDQDLGDMCVSKRKKSAQRNETRLPWTKTKLNFKWKIWPDFTVQCDYGSTDFNRYFNHIWDKHSLNIGFSYKCDASHCTSQYKTVQSFRRHLTAKHYWFYEKYIKCYENHLNRDKNIDLQLFPKNIGKIAQDKKKL